MNALPERSGQALAVCDFIDFAEAYHSIPYWLSIVDVLMSPPATRGCVRWIEDVSNNLSTILRMVL